jgi:hypothetical protein
MLCERSPFATDEIARVTSAVGHTRSSISVLTESSIAPQEPVRATEETRWRVRPRLPTSLPTRSSSAAMRWFETTMLLNASASLPLSPTQSVGRRTEKSPSRTACNARRRRRGSIDSSCTGGAAGASDLPLRGPCVFFDSPDGLIGRLSCSRAVRT